MLRSVVLPLQCWLDPPVAVPRVAVPRVAVPRVAVPGVGVLRVAAQRVAVQRVEEEEDAGLAQRSPERNLESISDQTQIKLESISTAHSSAGPRQPLSCASDRSGGRRPGERPQRDRQRSTVCATRASCRDSCATQRAAGRAAHFRDLPLRLSNGGGRRRCALWQEQREARRGSPKRERYEGRGSDACRSSSVGRAFCDSRAK